MCEIVQPKTRKADWSGRFSNSDPIWRRLKQPRRTSHGVLMSSQDLFRIADEFVTLANTSSMNQNWLEIISSRSNHAAYIEVDVVDKSSSIVLYVSLLKGPCRIAMVLAAITNDAYSYVVGSL